MNGTLEGASTLLLGWPGTSYPLPFPLRGMEFDDTYLIAGNVLTVNMHVFQPGDWIRVVTQGSLAVPEPSTYLILAGFLVLATMLKRRQKQRNIA